MYLFSGTFVLWWNHLKVVLGSLVYLAHSVGQIKDSGYRALRAHRIHRCSARLEVTFDLRLDPVVRFFQHSLLKLAMSLGSLGGQSGWWSVYCFVSCFEYKEGPRKVWRSLFITWCGDFPAYTKTALQERGNMGSIWKSVTTTIVPYFSNSLSVHLHFNFGGVT